MSFYKLPPSIHDQLDKFEQEYKHFIDKRVTKREKAAVIATEGFQIGLVTYLILLLLETLKEGFVAYFFNMNYLLGFVLITGIIMVLTKNDEKDAHEVEPEKLTFWKWMYILFMNIGGAGLVLYKTSELGTISLFISLFTLFIILLISILIYSENEKSD